MQGLVLATIPETLDHEAMGEREQQVDDETHEGVSGRKVQFGSGWFSNWRGARRGASDEIVVVPREKDHSVEEKSSRRKKCIVAGFVYVFHTA